MITVTIKNAPANAKEQKSTGLQWIKTGLGDYWVCIIDTCFACVITWVSGHYIFLIIFIIVIRKWGSVSQNKI
jgi:hypothetical protein